MKNYKEYNYLLLRAVMGINMTIHGGVRLFGDYSAFISKMEKMFEPTFLPNFLISFGANFISPVEFIFGIFLLIGFKTKISILVLNLNMMLLISGVCLLQKWELAGLQMAYVLYLFFIGNFIEFNKVSVDHLLITKGKNNE
ncbi:TQO small subunit DoxD [Halobacteriovorax sp.]|uniref:TQO small subunit DoxD n=1 Tax=Halobacteriovorax sp. TaxID=2020862 RepID=UPI0035629029